MSVGGIVIAYLVMAVATVWLSNVWHGHRHYKTWGFLLAILMGQAILLVVKSFEMALT